jgi:DNA polymerase alpha-associated DNA helicase A
MDNILRSLKEGSVLRHERKLKWEELRTLRRELKQRQHNALLQLIRQCTVILTTCVGAGDRLLQHDNDFDLVVIDEATQATQPQALIPLLKGRRLLLVGGEILHMNHTLS